MVKTSLISALRHKTLNEEEFRTAISECQAVVNNRPLTYLGNRLDEEALMPSHLVRGYSLSLFLITSPLLVECQQ